MATWLAERCKCSLYI